jgi:hypothetical protein
MVCEGPPLRLQGVYRATFQSVQGWRQSLGEEAAQLVESVWIDRFLCDSLLKISRQVCFRKGRNSTFDDIDDFGDDENIVSVDDLLAQAAEDPNSDGDGIISDEEPSGSPLSAGSALAPANTTFRNRLLCIFYDAAQVARERLSAFEGEQAGSSSQLSLPPMSASPSSSQPSLPPTSAGPSRSTMTSSSSAQSQTLGQRSSNEDVNQDNPTHPSSSAGINLNGKRPHTQLPVPDKENLERLLPPVHVPNKKQRGGPTIAKRGGRRNK